MVGKESKMKNKFIRKWLVILTVAAMMIPAGIPANAETVEEGENIAPTAGISAETPNVTGRNTKGRNISRNAGYDGRNTE